MIIKSLIKKILSTLKKEIKLVQKQIEKKKFFNYYTMNIIIFLLFLLMKLVLISRCQEIMFEQKVGKK